MFLRKALFTLAFTLAVYAGFAQACVLLGQTPATAFPVCGTDTFHQDSVPICGNKDIPVPCSDNAGYQDKNPYWYKFTCFTGGTLGFVITPDTLSDDYDWQLFDITGRNPNDVFTDKSLFVSGNWSGDGGKTGTGPSGNSNIACAGFGQPLYSKMPTLIQGHNYLLLVSHFTDTQSGYSLEFGGGTASITDTKVPDLLSGSSYCGGLFVGIKLNKKMKCSSLAANGSDFNVVTGLASIVKAEGIGCANGFDMDSVVLTLTNTLVPGNYDVLIKDGTDFNTLFDNCNNNIAPGKKVNFPVYPIQPTPLDSIEPVGCKPQSLFLDFTNSMQCSSIAADGSDFVLTGPEPVTITGASGICEDGYTTRIVLNLSAPIQRGGLFQVTLKRGSDGNTLLDRCYQETPAGSSIQVATHDTVSADFTYQVHYGCVTDTVYYFHDGANGVNQWNWTFDNLPGGSQQNAIKFYSAFGNKNVKLAVSNGYCSDTASQSLTLDNFLKADFSAPEFLCPNDQATFTDLSVGNIIGWNWDFGTGFRSTSPDPGPIQYPAPLNRRQQPYSVRLIVENDHHCFDTATHMVTAVNTCIIAVPNAFTPNNDGHNDFLYPLNAWKADNLVFKVYNRYGQVVFETRDWTRKWDGSINGHQQESGVYVWVLQYIDHDSGTPVFKRGTAVLIR